MAEIAVEPGPSLDLTGEPWAKDGKGRISLHMGGDIAPSGLVAERNRMSRVLLKDGESFEVLVRVGTTEFVQCSGTAKAGVGNLCSILLRTRVEQDVAEPPEPVVEP